MKFFLIQLATFAIILLPQLALAQVGEDGTLGPGQGFVACSGAECDTCHFVVMANTIIRWLMGVIAVIFAVLVAVTGWGLITSQGNPGALKEAKGKFVNVFIGLIIVLGAWLFVDTLMLGLTGEGVNTWGEVECGSQEDTTFVQNEIREIEDIFSAVSIPPSAGGHCPIGFIFNAFGSCEPRTGPVSPDAAGNCPVGYTRSADSCTIQSGRISPDAGGNCPPGYIHDPFGDCEFRSSGVTVNNSMGPIFDPSQGGSSLVRSGAGGVMQQTLAGPYARLQQSFGRPVVINDAIAKAGSSRETETTGSRHFHGDALDLSTAGLSNTDKIRLFNEAKRAGFTGFGFGNNILHVDTGPKRSWSYGNSTYGGVSVEQMKAQANR